MRIQGGTMGLLSAIFAGRLDPLDPDDPPVPDRVKLTSAADWRLYERRTTRRLKKAKRRERERLAGASPF